MTILIFPILLALMALYISRYYRSMNLALDRKNLGAVLIVTLAMGVLFDYFFYGKMLGLSFPIYVILLLAGPWGLAVYLKKSIKRDIAWLVAAIVFFSSMLAVRASEFLSFLNFFMTGYLLLLLVRKILGTKIKEFEIIDYVLTAVATPFRILAASIKTLVMLGASGGSDDLAKERTRQIIRGIVITAPIIFVLILLLSSSDLIFGSIVDSIITVDVEVFLRVGLVLFMALIWTGAYAYTLGLEKEHEMPRTPHAQKGAGRVESLILLGSINVLFLLFIIIQITYLFGGSNTISEFGYTYSEYARKGFAELIVAAIIVFFVLWVTGKILNLVSDRGLKFFSLFLIAQSFIIMASAGKRLLLYEQAYGLTASRLYSLIFTALLAAIFLLMAYKIFSSRPESFLAYGVAISVILFLGAVNLINPDAIIARRNIERFGFGEKQDIGYLDNLSDDAMPELIKVLQAPESLHKSAFVQILYRKREGSSDPNQEQWQQWSWSRRNASELLKSQSSDLKKYKDFKWPQPGSTSIPPKPL